MSIAVASFYADVYGQPSRFKEYYPYILAARRALELTNPKARFFILTDDTTAGLFSPKERDEFIISLADGSLPLMLMIIDAQSKFVSMWGGYDLVLLPDVDCFANRNLDDSIPRNVGLAITHKGPKFHYRINNMAYIRDQDLAVWFLNRAFRILSGWSAEKHAWWGDQEAWQSALGVPINGLGYWTVVERLSDEILIARRRIVLSTFIRVRRIIAHWRMMVRFARPNGMLT